MEINSGIPSCEEIKMPTQPGTINQFVALAFTSWLTENEKDLKPPVNNKCIQLGKDFIVMVVGGPNERSDYHINNTEEWFFQIKGDMLLRTVDESTNTFQDNWIKEGQMFLLPANVPHNPVRFENTIGIVIERVRDEHHTDALRWYCKKCSEIVYEETFKCKDIRVQLKEIIEKYCGDENLRTCKCCQHINT